ncbi:phosphatidylglycerol lysyltransferase domain-containing protein [Microvirga sp. 2YAF29]|uniref:phosphatidylglycerol lysyltransferase domain-containing protein n=1 Tax=Microvirga sp. 2YAF29 TaxID=3233031 RepID=UPI003F9A4766
MADLASIEVEDADLFLGAMEEARVKAAFYFFPHLYFAGRTSTRSLLWERHAGSILIYQVRRQKGGSEMRLYCPPLPFDASALRHAMQRMQEFNSSRSSRISYVPEEQALQVMREGFSIELKSEDFIYDRAAVVALEGARFAKLRQELARALRQGQVETRPYTSADRPGCVALTEAWRERLVARGMKVGAAYGVTSACLTSSHRFQSPLLTGMVVEVDGKLCGFGFSGQLTSGMGCNYACVTDLAYPGLTLVLRRSVMGAFPHLAHFNDADDAKRPELHASKQRFQPVEMHGVFKATLQ